MQTALDHPGKIDMDRVRAQEARRVLDRVVGYPLSNLLSKKVARPPKYRAVGPVQLLPVLDERIQTRQLPAVTFAYKAAPHGGCEEDNRFMSWVRDVKFFMFAPQPNNGLGA